MPITPKTGSLFHADSHRVNVLHGRKSMSWAKSVLPLFTGTSSETFRKVPDRVQIDTTLNRQNRVQNHPFIGRHRLLNRTAVMTSIKDPVLVVWEAINLVIEADVFPYAPLEIGCRSRRGSVPTNDRAG
jgi:hypothetical protein